VSFAGIACPINKEFSECYSNMAKFFDWFGVYDNIEFLKIKYAIRAVFPEHDIRLPSGDLESVIAVLEESFPAEKDDIRKLFKEMVNVYEDIMKFFYSTAPMWQQLPVFPFRYKSLFSVMKKTVKEILDKHLKNNKLKAILFANYGFYGLPPSRLSVLGLCANVDYWMQGAFYPKGGNQMIPNAFVDIIKQNHGEILLGSEVAHIIVERNKAIGVVTKKGDKYFGKNVVSNASAIETFYNLVGKEKVPEKFIEKIDRMESSDSGFRVCLGLDDAFKLEPKNIDDYEILVSDTYDQDVDYEWICNCDVEHASFFITLYSNIDVSLAKRNGFVMSLMQKQPYSYWKKFETSYNAGNKEDYNKKTNLQAY
jgi:prolycopene isomerase